MLLSIIVSASFLALVILIDNFYYKKIILICYKEKRLDDQISKILFMKNKYQGINLILKTFSNNDDIIFNDKDSNDITVDKITHFYNLKRFDILKKSILKNNRNIYKLNNILKKDYINYEKYKSTYNNIKTFYFFICIIEIILSVLHPFYAYFYSLNVGIVFHIILGLSFILCLLLNSYYFKSLDSLDYVKYYEALCLIEKPLEAFDSFCLLYENIGERLYLLKNSLINNDEEALNEYINRNSSEKELLFYINESIKGNKSIKYESNLNYKKYKPKYILKTYVLLNISSFLIILLFGILYL